jgi:hypothetical protein
MTKPNLQARNRSISQAISQLTNLENLLLANPTNLRIRVRVRNLREKVASL